MSLVLEDVLPINIDEISFINFLNCIENIKLLNYLKSLCLSRNSIGDEHFAMLMPIL